MAVKILNGIDVEGSMNIVASDVPNLDASKITSGTFSTDRIPSLSGIYQPIGNYLTSVPSEYLTQTEGDARYLKLTGGTLTGTLTLSAVNPRIDFNGTSDAGVDMAIVATPEGLNFIEPEQGDKVQFQILDDTGVNSPFGYQWNGQSLDSRYASASHNHNTLYDSIGSADAVQTWVGEQNFATDAAINTAVSNYLPLSGGNITGNTSINGDLDVGAVGKTSDTVVRSLADQSYKAGFEAYGNGQGTGYFYAGQSNSYGGGFSYNGDGSPGFISGETADHITFFRRSADTNTEVFHYAYSSNDVYFNGAVVASGSNSNDWNTAYGWGNHASAGYLTSIPSAYATDAEVNAAVDVVNTRIETEVLPAISSITLASLGYTGATNANYITNNNQLTNGAGYATTSYVNTAVSNLVDTAPAALNTLNELAAALGDDANFSTTVANSIGAIDSRIDTEVLPAIDAKQNAGNYATFTNNIYLGNSATTANFITQLSSLGAFQDNYKAFKVAWDYAGNSNLDVGFESVELAGCVIECWGGTYKHVRLTRPTTGTGGRSIYVYNDQGGTYAPGWRQIWTSDEFSSTNVSNWNTAYGWGNHASVGYLTSIPSSYATDAEVATAVAAVDARIDQEILPAVDTKLDATAKAADSNLLDGINSTSFLRSDQADTMSGTLTITGSNGVSRLRIEGTTPTIDLDDADGDSFYIHVNANNFYVLADRGNGGNYGEWETPHPLLLEADTNRTYLWGNLVGNAAYASTSDFDSAGTGAAEAGAVKTWVQEQNYASDAAINTAIATVTLSSLGYTGDTNANYITNNNQLTNGAGYLTTLPSHDHSRIVENAAITYGAGQLQWTDVNGNGGTGLNGAAPGNPFSEWWHHIIMNHANSSGYYVDIAACFHSDDLYFRRNVAGSLSSWKEIIHDGNIGTYADAAGSADAVNSRIENEVLPAIPTNNNQLTNGAGYITDGNTNWNNSYGFITEASYIKAGGAGPGTENLNTIADSVVTGELEYRGFNLASSNRPPASDNANGVITVGQHSGNYNAQLAFSSDGNMYWRDNPSTSYGSWRTVWDSDNLDAFVGATVSNDTITFTKANGGTVAVTTSDANTNTWRPIDDTPVNGVTDQSISSNWAYDHVNASNPHGTTAADVGADAAGSAAAVDTRIDTEVMPAIGGITLASLGYTGATNANYITNNNQLTNGAGYITGVPSSFSTNTITIGGGVTLTESTDRADLLYINSGTSTWGGLQIGNTSNEFIFSLMGDGNAGGIYDDQNGDWIIYWAENAGVELKHNTNTKLTTTSTGVSITGALVASGDVTAFSDARIKENVETLPNALDSVKQMRGVTYNKIGEEKQSVGVIAQELEEVVPQLVHTDEEGMKSVAYGNITAVLIEALKEQQAQIEELKARLDGLTK